MCQKAVRKVSDVTWKTWSVAGTSGMPTVLLSNYFKLLSAPNWHFYQYRVDFSPTIDSKVMRRRFVNEHHELLGPVRSFDGQILYLPLKLQEKVRHFI